MEYVKELMKKLGKSNFNNGKIIKIMVQYEIDKNKREDEEIKNGRDKNIN